jgi:predicted PurR-regulated permease PerM
MSRFILVPVVVLAVVLLGALVRPFASALLMAAVLAAALSPAHEGVAVRLRSRRSLAAALVTAAIAFALVLPVVGLALAVANDTTEAATHVAETLQKDGVSGLIAEMPPPLRNAAHRIIDRVPHGEKQISDYAASHTGKLVQAVGGMIVVSGGILFQTVLMLAAFYFFLLDGEGLVRWLTEVGPLKEVQMTEMLSDFRDVSVAVMVSTVATAALQAIVALAGFLVTRTPQPLIFAVLTFVAAFIPLVGATSVVVAGVVLLFATGHVRAGLALCAFVVLVSLVDHTVKPYLMKGRMAVHGGVAFFSLLGGVAAFGPVGILMGPLVVAFFLAAVRMCRKELSRPLPAAETGPPAAP